MEQLSAKGSSSLWIVENLVDLHRRAAFESDDFSEVNGGT